jgi:hypothetical protein
VFEGGAQAGREGGRKFGGDHGPRELHALMEKHAKKRAAREGAARLAWLVCLALLLVSSSSRGTAS